MNRSALVFLRSSRLIGYAAILLAFFFISLIIRGFFFNTLDQTVTPLNKYSVRQGIIEEAICGETSIYETIVYLKIYHYPQVFEVITQEHECSELMPLIRKGLPVTFWLHPSVDNLVGQLLVNGETLVDHSGWYERAWRQRRNFALVAGVASIWLLYFAFIGQFKKKRQ